MQCLISCCFVSRRNGWSKIFDQCVGLVAQWLECSRFFILLCVICSELFLFVCSFLSACVIASALQNTKQCFLFKLFSSGHFKSQIVFFLKLPSQLPLATPSDWLKISRKFFNQWETKPKPIHFSRALSKVQVIARNFDWFIAMFAPVVKGRINYFSLVLFFWESFETALFVNIVFVSPWRQSQSDF